MLEDSAAIPYLETACLATACGHPIPVNQAFPQWYTQTPSPSLMAWLDSEGLCPLVLLYACSFQFWQAPGVQGGSNPEATGRLETTTN